MRTFETIRYQANKYCPCGKSNRDGKFTTEKGFKNQPIGHCFSCDKDFWNKDEFSQVESWSRKIQKEIVINYCHPDWKEIQETFDYNLQSGFTKFLVQKFGSKKAQEVVETYLLGNYKGDVIFWQMDRYNEVRAGKIMSYNSNGKRANYGNWWHSINGLNCQIRQCLFGDHLIPENNKPIAVVESEKTACIMHLCNPYYIWLSAGGKSGLNDKKCASIKKYEVVLFPDVDAFDQWEEIANKHGFDISNEPLKWAKEGIIDNKGDIADYYLNKYSPQVLSN